MGWKLRNLLRVEYRNWIILTDKLTHGKLWSNSVDPQGTEWKCKNIFVK